MLFSVHMDEHLVEPIIIFNTVTVTVTIDGLVKLLAFNAHIFASKYPVSF